MLHSQAAGRLYFLSLFFLPKFVIDYGDTPHELEWKWVLILMIKVKMRGQKILKRFEDFNFCIPIVKHCNRLENGV